jgi:hypothetical protein
MSTNININTIFVKTHLYWCANKAMDNGIVDKAWIIQNQHGPFQQVFIPNPLGKMGENWKKHQDGDDNTFINLLIKTFKQPSENLHWNKLAIFTFLMIYTTISKTIQNFLSKTNSKYEKNECKH